MTSRGKALQKKATLFLGKIQQVPPDVTNHSKSRFKAQLQDFLKTKLAASLTLLKSMETNFREVMQSNDPKIIDYDHAAVATAVKEAREVSTATLIMYKLIAKKEPKLANKDKK